MLDRPSHSSSLISRRKLFWLSTGAGLAALTGCSRFSRAGFDPKTVNWETVVERSRGTTVRWAMWDGSDSMNRFVDKWVSDRLKQQYSITLTRVPLDDTVEAVNKVVGEVQSGAKQGSLDLVWINGENFRTLKQGKLLFGPFRDRLPSLRFYDADSTAITIDTGVATDGYSAPFTGSYFAMAVNTARVPRLPATYTQLLTWAKANPGRLTYVAPPAPEGKRFLLTALYATTGGYRQYLGDEFDETQWEAKAAKAMVYLKRLAPHLWRNGKTYPTTQSQLAELFAKGEIWIMPISVNRLLEGIVNQQFPTTTKVLAMRGVSLCDPAFTAIPINAPNPAGAMVLADFLASPRGQLQKFSWQGWNNLPALDVQALPGKLQTQFTAVETRFGISLKDLVTQTVPMVNEEYTTRLAQVWQEQIAQSIAPIIQPRTR